MIRDQALFVSGLLVEKLGGPSVKPYQPDGLYKDMVFSNMTDYGQEKGEGLWRRSLYTFWKRTMLPPTMQVFDASPRESCTVARDAHEHAAAGAQPDERRDLCRSGADAGRADDEEGGRSPKTASPGRFALSTSGACR